MQASRFIIIIHRNLRVRAHTVIHQRYSTQAHSLSLTFSLFSRSFSLFLFQTSKKKERDRKKMMDHEMRSSTSSLRRHLVILYYIEKKLLPDFLRFWRCDSTKLSGNSKRAPRGSWKSWRWSLKMTFWMCNLGRLIRRRVHVWSDGW